MLASLIATCTIGIAAEQRATPGAAATARAVAAAEAFLATLDPPQRLKANIGLDDKSRAVWSNLPTGIAMQVGAMERNGVKLGDMTPAQEKAALALLTATLSPEGFQKAMADRRCRSGSRDRSAPTRGPAQRIRFGRAEYYVSILGKPSATDKWMIQFGGHHLAINVTLAGRENVLAPTHTGTQPALLPRRRQDDSSAGRRERQGVRADQRAQSGSAEAGHPQQRGPQPRAGPWRRRQDDRARGSPRLNLHAGPARDARRSGARVGRHSRRRGISREDGGDPGGLNDTYFAWAGATTNGKGAYFRIQGPAVFIEYAPQGSADDTSDHIHTIYREPANDYAAKALSRSGQLLMLAFAAATLATFTTLRRPFTA